MILEDRYINPLTDFGFKKLFGEEVNKDLLIDFLNTLLPEKHTIKDLKYQQNEHLPSTEYDRKAIFDLFCESASANNIRLTHSQIFRHGKAWWRWLKMPPSQCALG